MLLAPLYSCQNYLIKGTPLLVLYATILSMTGCTQPSFKPLCPPLVHYSPQEEKEVATELRTHPDMKKISLFLMDYGAERNEIRQNCP